MEFFNCATKHRKKTNGQFSVEVIDYLSAVNRVGEQRLLSTLNNCNLAGTLFGVNMENVQGYLPFFSVLNSTPTFISIPSGDKVFQKELITLLEDFNCVVDFGNLKKEELKSAILTSTKKFIVTNAILTNFVDDNSIDSETMELLASKNCLLVLNLSGFNLKTLATCVAVHIKKFGYFNLALCFNGRQGYVNKFAKQLIKNGVEVDIVESILKLNALKFWDLELKTLKLMQEDNFSNKFLLTNCAKVC